MEQPDHNMIIGAVAEMRGEFRTFREEVIRRLGQQDKDLETLKTAHNVAAGKSAMTKTFYTTMAGGLGAGIVKVVEWLNHNGVHLPPTGTPGAH